MEQTNPKTEKKTKCTMPKESETITKNIYLTLLTCIYIYKYTHIYILNILQQRLAGPRAVLWIQPNFATFYLCVLHFVKDGDS